MKTEALKRIIKEAVREAIQEELKEVLLEAVKAPKAVVTQPIQESITSTTPAPVTQTPKKSLAEQRQKYMDIIGETGIKMNSSHAQGLVINHLNLRAMWIQHPQMVLYLLEKLI